MLPKMSPASIRVPTNMAVEDGPVFVGLVPVIAEFLGGIEPFEAVKALKLGGNHHVTLNVLLDLLSS